MEAGTGQQAIWNLHSRPSLTLLMSKSSPSSFRFSSNFSSSSFKQSDLQHLSSSSIGPNRELFKNNLPTVMGNETWDLKTQDLKVNKARPTNMFLDRVNDDLMSNIPERFQPVKAGNNYFVVNTFTEKVPVQMDIGNMTLCDLDALKEQDAFMYYSIPGVKGWKGKVVDVDEMKDSSHTVKRSSAIAFESADLWFEDDDAVGDVPNPNEAVTYDDEDDYAVRDRDYISFLYDNFNES